MPLTQLDSNTALIVIDLQKGLVGLPAVHPITDVVKHAAELAEVFRAHQLPVVLVTAAGAAPDRTEQPSRLTQRPPGWADLVPELNHQPQDHLVVKRTWGAFSNSGLDGHLKNLGITQVVIAGVATSAGVESTARHAHELGYNVTLAIDAMTDLYADAHTNSVTRIFPRIGETGTTREIIGLLAKRSV